MKASDMAQEFIERRGEGYYFVGSRVSLDSIVFQFLRGESPEGILQAFPSLSLLQVYGGITFYLDRRARHGRRIRCFTQNWMQRGTRQPESDVASISG
jgi:uncharacterized protein (DUF433 family)